MKPSKRHPCEVTADRLIDHAEKYRAQGDIADAISRVRHWLLDRADERGDSRKEGK